MKMQKYSFKNLNLRAKFQNLEEHVATADASSACLPRANKPSSSEGRGGDWRGRDGGAVREFGNAFMLFNVHKKELV